MGNEKENIVPTLDDITEADFAYVNIDKSIHDTKFETKPTTFFKDALKRFAKNKSSVVAAGILATIIAMAIIVPLADQNNIAEVMVDNDTHYLPPKWFDNAGGFLDGTSKIEGAIVDPLTGLPDENQYKSRAIVRNEGQDLKDAISLSESRVEGVTENILKYGKGGNIALSVSSKEENETYVGEPSTMTSPSWNLVKGDNVNLTYTFDRDSFLEKNNEGTTLYASLLLLGDLDGDGENEEYALAEEVDAHELSSWNVDVFSKIPSGVVDSMASSVSVSVQLKIRAESLADSANRLYLTSVSATSNGSDLSLMVFDDAVQQVVKERNKEVPNSQKYTYSADSNRTLQNVLVKRASFRYDHYEAAYGEEEMEISETDLRKYMDLGFLTWNWEDKPSTPGHEWQEASADMYQILDLEHSPIREVKSFKRMVTDNPLTGHIEVRSLRCTVSLYRYYWVEGKLGTCAMPHMLFGTNANGQDFFKIVFSGLLTSLGLGLLSATINIFVGLIWGAISGYFGGWTDLMMERFMEILGGMPWIVMMTLIVLLLGSGFWTLLLALCLTGWMGIAGTTRSQFYRFKRREYVLASRTLGASDARLIFKHILPNGIGTIVTGAVLMIPSVIFTEANVAYLLPGVLQYEGGIVSFGITLSEAQKSLQDHPYLIVSASIVMILIMIAFNLFGNGLRDAFNPSLKGADE